MFNTKKSRPDYMAWFMFISYVVWCLCFTTLVLNMWDMIVLSMMRALGLTAGAVVKAVIVPVPIVESKVIGTVRPDVASGFLGLSVKTWVFIGVGVGIAILIGYGVIHYAPLLFGARMADQISAMRWDQLVDLACQHGDQNGNDFLLTGLDEVGKLAVIPGAQIGQVEMGRQLCTEVVCQGTLVGDRLARLAESAFQH